MSNIQASATATAVAEKAVTITYQYGSYVVKVSGTTITQSTNKVSAERRAMKASKAIVEAAGATIQAERDRICGELFANRLHREDGVMYVPLSVALDIVDPAVKESLAKHLI